MPDVQNILGVGRLWIISFYISDVFLKAGLHVPVSLTYIREVAGFAS